MPSSHRRVARFALAAVLLAGTLPVSPAAAQPAPPAPGVAAPPSPRPGLDALRARLPERAEAFRREDVSLHPAVPGEPEGLLARYRSRGAEASLFLYGFPGVDLPDGTASPALRGELELDGDDLRDQLRRSGANPRDGEASVILRGVPLLLCRTFRRPEGRLLRSDWLCLGGVAGRSFKLHVLARHAAAASDETARTVSRLAVALVRAVAGDAGPG